MKKTLLVPFCILAASFVCGGSALAVPLILDGSFESPVIGTTGSVLGGGDSWTPGYDATGKGVYILSNNTGAGKTTFGTQFLTLNPGTTDTQSINGFSIGTTYTVNAYFADLFNGTAPALQMTIAGLAGLTTTSTTTTPVNGFYGSGNIPFTLASLTFIATATTETLTLTDMSTNGTIGIDNVSFPVPEPSSYVGLALGMGVIGWTIARVRARRTL